MTVPFIVEGVLLFIIGIFGLCGNISAIVKFATKKGSQKNFYFLMLALAIFDSVSSNNLL